MTLDDLLMLGSHDRLDFVRDNIDTFLRSKKLEQAFVRSWISHNVLVRPIPYNSVDAIVSRCDIKKIKRLYPLPTRDRRMVLYRGDGGGGPMPMSWTSDIDVARYFAGQKGGCVVSAWVPTSHILFYSNSRGEKEYVLKPGYAQYTYDHSSFD